MNNPFDEIMAELKEIKETLAVAKSTPGQSIEIIDRVELQKRLSISEPTIIAWERKGKIPCFRIGSSVRYNWFSVVATLESKKNK